MFSLIIPYNIAKAMEKLHPLTMVRIDKKILSLQHNQKPRDARPLQGYPRNVFRVRVGKYRIIYHVNWSRSQILIMEVDKRSRIYKP